MPPATADEAKESGETRGEQLHQGGHHLVYAGAVRGLQHARHEAVR